MRRESSPKNRRHSYRKHTTLDYDDGFNGYYLIEDGSGVLTSVSLFDTSAHADESTQLASTWVRDEQLEGALPNPPKITFGEVIVKSNGVAVA